MKNLFYYLLYSIYVAIRTLHFSFFIEFCEAKFFWASRCAGFTRLRRAIRSITFAALPLRWFRYYPSRFACFARRYRRALRASRIKYDQVLATCYQSREAAILATKRLREG